MPIWLIYILIALATARVTRLLVADTIPVIAVPREWLHRWLDPRDKDNRKLSAPLGSPGRSLAYLMTCEWCTSVYVATAVVFLTAEYVSVPLPWLVVGAACMFTGWASTLIGWGEEWWKVTLYRRWLLKVELAKNGLKDPSEE